MGDKGDETIEKLHKPNEHSSPRSPTLPRPSQVPPCACLLFSFVVFNPFLSLAVTMKSTIFAAALLGLASQASAVEPTQAELHAMFMAQYGVAAPVDSVSPSLHQPYQPAGKGSGAHSGPGGTGFPGCSDGARPLCANGSSPIKGASGPPTCADGSTPLCSDGTAPTPPTGKGIQSHAGPPTGESSFAPAGTGKGGR